jgi:hypothetical protein
MADLAELIATYDALVGVALGAGLTYGFSALNRRLDFRLCINDARGAVERP